MKIFECILASIAVVSGCCVLGMNSIESIGGAFAMFGVMLVSITTIAVIEGKGEWWDVR